MTVRSLRPLGLALAALAVLCVALWGSAVGYMWLNEERFVFRSEFSRRADRTLDPVFTPLQLTTADGIRLDAVTLTAERATTPRRWLIYFQGNAGSLRRPRVQQQ